MLRFILKKERNYFLIFFFLLFAKVGLFPNHVLAAKYAALVMDAHSGKILHRDNINTLVHPASLTKMMTIWIIFEELEAGRLTLDSTFKISSYAAKQVPTKLGIPAGGSVSMKVALLALITRSANDVAMAVAERISGTETAFVQRMNQTALLLGMKNTQFRNPSGLPHKQQLTTAMDMGLLSQALLKKFPNYYRYFKTKTFDYKGQKINNHNKLLGRVDGLDGIKTGFTNAAGFSIATSALRNGQRLIAVVMGGETSKWRNNRVTQLLEISFAKLKNKTQKDLFAPLPLVSKEILMKKPSLPLAETMSDFIENNFETIQSLEPADEDLSLTPNPLKEKITVIEKSLQEITHKLPLASYPQADWVVQIGIYKKPEDAHMAAAVILSKLPKECEPIISVERSSQKKKRSYRAGLKGFDKQAAYKICQVLKTQGIPAFVFRETSKDKLQSPMVEKG